MMFLFVTLWIIAGTCDGYIIKEGNPDDTAIISRPCLIFDVNCMRQFIADHSHCTIVKGPAPDPLIRSQSNLYAPQVNLSVTLVNEEIRGLNGRIDEFYVNKATDNAVLSVEFRNFTLSSNNSYFSFQRKDKEPVVTTGAASITYPSVVMTAVIPKINDLQLENAEITVFINDRTQPMVLEPTLAESSDPQVQVAVAEFQADTPTALQELFLTDAYYHLTAYVQYVLCDFGLKIL